MKRILFLLFAFSLPVYADIFETQVEQDGSQTGSFGVYRLWLPPDCHPNRILVLVWGSNQCSLSMVEDSEWQKLAGSTHCALLSCFYYPQTYENHWDRAGQGSGEALLKAVQNLSQITGEAQLANSSFYLVGDSQGGEFAFNFAAWQPSRTLGFISLKGGRHDISSVSAAAEVPGLFCAGKLDSSFRMANIANVFSKGRSLGAPWCLAIDPLGTHDPDRCGGLVASFLRSLSTVSSRHNHTEAVQGTEPTSAPSWFPDAEFKSEWQKFESGQVDTSAARLSFTSKMPVAPATIAPKQVGLGSIVSGDISPEISLDVSSNEISGWDTIRVLNLSYLQDVKVEKVSSNHFTASAHLSTVDLPLGRFSGVIPVRFELQGKPVLGGIDVPINATILGDVVATPSLILLDQNPSTGTKSIQLRITSKSNRPVHLVSYEAPLGVEVKDGSASQSPLELSISFDGHRTERGSSGSILLHLKTDKAWTLRIPFIGTASN